MRIISQDGEYDFPYEISTVRMCVGNDDRHYWIAVNSNCIDSYWNFAVYSSKQKAEKVMEMLRTAYTGRFVTNTDVSDDFNEQLKELMKGGFGTVIVKDTNDRRVEFNNLNGYFQFPQDEDVEV